MRGLDSKVAIVTGGAGRIGRGVVARLFEEGVKVAVADINLAAAKTVAGLYGASALGIGFDAANTGSIEAMIAGAVRHFVGSTS
jgi:NAD(P)-dependent dehydrogenase (short-subunit alcohol dehydrogenase family)